MYLLRPQDPSGTFACRSHLHRCVAPPLPPKSLSLLLPSLTLLPTLLILFCVVAMTHQELIVAPALYTRTRHLTCLLLSSYLLRQAIASITVTITPATVSDAFSYAAAVPPRHCRAPLGVDCCYQSVHKASLSHLLAAAICSAAPLRRLCRRHYFYRRHLCRLFYRRRRFSSSFPCPIMS